MMRGRLVHTAMLAGVAVSALRYGSVAALPKRGKVPSFIDSVDPKEPGEFTRQQRRAKSRALGKARA